jgi:hypothetical protein
LVSVAPEVEIVRSGVPSECVFRRRPKDPDADAAQQRLSEAVGDLDRARRSANDLVRAARDALEQEMKRYTRRISDAQKDVDRAFDDKQVAALGSGLSKVLDEKAPPKLVLRETTLRIGDRIRPVTPDLKASVESEGNLATKSRVTLTRIGLGGLVAGPLGAVVGAGVQKSEALDKRALYLLFESDAWAFVRKCDPDQGQAAREFAQQVNLASRQVAGVRDRQLHAARGAHEALAAAAADRESMTALAAALEEARAGATAQVEAARGPVRTALEDIDGETRAARKALQELDKPPLDVKVAAPLELPEAPEVIDPAQLHGGAAAVERLATAISLLDRLGNPGLKKLAATVTPDEEPMVVAVSNQAALLVTSRRLVVANAEGVRAIGRGEVLAVDRAGLLGGGLKVRTREDGELSWGSLKPERIADDVRALLAEPVELQATEEPTALPPGPPAQPELSASPVAGDAIEQIRRLAELRDAGVLTEQEFAAKKDELLKRV